LLKALLFFSIPPSVCPSVRKEQLGSHWKNFYWKWYLIIFLKFVENFKIYKNQTRMTDACTQTYLAQFFLEWEISQTKHV
jgi:hypothetical protein